MPICPIDGVQLIVFTEDVSAQAFYECPAHKGRFVAHGIAGLIPVPRAVIADPLVTQVDPLNKKALTSFYYDNSDTSVWFKKEGDTNYTKLQTSGGAGDLTYLELNATGQSAGNLNLTDATWNESKIQIDYIKVTVMSGSVTDFDIAIFEKDSFLAADKRYEAKGLNSTDNWEDDLEWTYIDDDATKEVHFKITENTGGPGTYNIQLRGVKLI